MAATRESLRDGKAEALFEAWKLKWELEPEFELKKITVRDDTQSRHQGHRAPHKEVERYLTQMRGQLADGGLLYPPLAVTPTGELVDGNTRRAAFAKLGIEKYPAYVITFANLGQARLLGAALNMQAGRTLTPEEVIEAAERYLAAGYADEAVARELGVSVSHIRNVRREREYREHAERVNLEKVKVGKPAQRVLSGLVLDSAFTAATELVAETMPQVKQVTQLVEAVKAAPSEQEAIKAVEEVRAEWKPSGPPPPRNQTPGARPSKGIKLAGGLVEFVAADAVGLVPGDLEARAQAHEVWLAAQQAATTVVQAIRAAESVEVA